jgi:hypothetical protein
LRELSRIIAVDPGSKTTGCAVFDGNEISCYSVEARRGKYGFFKLRAMADDVIKLVRPGDWVIFEDYGFGGTFFNAEVPELCALIKDRLYDLQSNKVMFIAPNTIKKVIAGHGNATKAMVTKEVKEKTAQFDIILKSAHEADAVAILLTFLRYVTTQLDPKTMKALSGRILDFKEDRFV